jgi:hypothetical protein
MIGEGFLASSLRLTYSLILTSFRVRLNSAAVSSLMLKYSSFIG